MSNRALASIVMVIGVCASPIFAGKASDTVRPATFDESATVTCGVGGWTTVPTPVISKADMLLGVSARGVSTPWMVGHEAGTVSGKPTTGHTLAERWNGSRFLRVTTPTPNGNANLADIHAWSDTSAIAVGWWTTSQLLPRPTSELWNGSTWSTLNMPAPSATNTAPYGVDGVSPTDAWAVGQVDSADATATPFASHWDGTRWQTVPTDPGVANGGFKDVRVFATDDVWAVGFEGGLDHLSSLAEHWDGSSWTRVAIPNVGTNNNQLFGIDGTGPSDIWAVGQYDGSELQPLALHWDGSTWNSSLTALAGVSNARLLSVSTLATGDVWVVGSSLAPGSNGVVSQGSLLGLIAHYDGGSWTVISNDVTSPQGSTFDDISRSDQPELWLTGGAMKTGLNETTLAEHICPNPVGDDGFETPSVSVRQGNATAWTFSSASGLRHEVTDTTSLHLFDSGPRAPGTSFTTRLEAAAGIAIRDPTTSKTAKLTIPVRLSQAKTSLSQPVTVTWAHANVQSYVEDIQISRPESTFVPWVTGTLALSQPFSPDAGSGSYNFRARLRDPTTGKATGWSPATTLTVT